MYHYYDLCLVKKANQGIKPLEQGGVHVPRGEKNFLLLFSFLLFSSLIIIQSHIFLRVAYKISSIHHHHQHLSIHRQRQRQRQRQNRQKAAEQKREFMSYINITIRYLDSILILFL